ncbi:hypothetical protein E2C01_032389 [Portunus trituberculatus]|uniref:Uncharacterized protein n=1 Tax=Portunus trituberculatus TaxID=210409 RepID=A0A5B7F2N0_PORTR|nr:hypothetical protein [Portunus trituberculatus]
MVWLSGACYFGEQHTHPSGIMSSTLEVLVVVGPVGFVVSINPVSRASDESLPSRHIQSYCIAEVQNNVSVTLLPPNTAAANAILTGAPVFPQSLPRLSAAIGSWAYILE